MASSEEKRWAKEARQRRQALKKAAPPQQNLFQARIRRQQGMHAASPRGLGIPILVIITIVAVVWWWKHRPASSWTPPLPSAQTASDTTPLQIPVASSATLATSTTTQKTAVAPTPVTDKSEPAALPTAISDLQTSTANAAPRVIAPDTREWQGATSQILDKRTVLVRGRAQWRALWTEMGQEGEPPRINFYDYSVVGVFAGAKTDPNAEVQLMDVRESEDSLTIPYREIESPVATTTPPAESAHPYHLRIIIRTNKSVKFVKT